MIDWKAKQLKFCYKCRKLKPELDFSMIQAKVRRFSYCRKCVINRATEWRKQNPVKSNSTIKNWRKSNPNKLISYNRQHRAAKYRLTIEELKLLEKQINCTICQQKQNNKLLAIDHDHDTGHVRGLLCDNCNKGLGFFRDNPDYLRKAADYLENYKQSLIKETNNDRA